MTEESLDELLLFRITAQMDNGWHRLVGWRLCWLSDSFLLILCLLYWRTLNICFWSDSSISPKLLSFHSLSAWANLPALEMEWKLWWDHNLEPFTILARHSILSTHNNKTKTLATWQKGHVGWCQFAWPSSGWAGYSQPLDFSPQFCGLVGCIRKNSQLPWQHLLVMVLSNVFFLVILLLRRVHLLITSLSNSTQTFTKHRELLKRSRNAAH